MDASVHYEPGGFNQICPIFIVILTTGSAEGEPLAALSGSPPGNHQPSKAGPGDIVSSRPAIQGTSGASRAPSTS